MKRILLATTALCFGAGTAVAQDMGMAPMLKLSGEAEMGVAGSKDDDARFHTDMDVTFKATGMMDGGVSWSADVDLDEVSDDTNTTAGPPAQTVDAATQDDDDDGGVTISISQPEGFGTLTMGDTDGALDWAMTEIGSGGIRSDSEHAAYSGNNGLDTEYDGQVLRYDRAIGSGFSFGASVMLDDDTGGTEGSDTADPIIGLGGQYAMPMAGGMLTLGAGYQAGEYDNEVSSLDSVADRYSEKADAQAVGASAKMDFGGDAGGFSVILNGSMIDADGSVTSGEGSAARTSTLDLEGTHFGLGLGYTVGAVSLGVNVGSINGEAVYDPDNRTVTAAQSDRILGDVTVTGVGFDAAYDLGGGASLQFGIGSSETEYDHTREADGTNPGRTTASVTGDSNTDTYKWSLGVAFKF